MIIFWESKTFLIFLILKPLDPKRPLKILCNNKFLFLYVYIFLAIKVSMSLIVLGPKIILFCSQAHILV